MNINDFLTQKNRLDAILRAAAKNSMARGEALNRDEDFLASLFIQEDRGYVVSLEDAREQTGQPLLELTIEESDSGSCFSAIYLSQEDLSKATAEVDAAAQ